MGKELWKPGNMLYPLPAVMVSLADQEGHPNIITLAWVGTVCTNPPMVSISVRPERYSYPILKETGEFVVNLTTESMAWATDYCGVRSGRDVDKFTQAGLPTFPAEKIGAPLVRDCVAWLECRVIPEANNQQRYDLFIAEVVAAWADTSVFSGGRWHFPDASRRTIHYQAGGSFFETGRTFECAGE